MAKVLLVNGSNREHGCTYTALMEVAGALEKEGIETEIFQLGGEPIRDCISCGGCGKLGKCVFGDDPVNAFVEKAKEADGFVFGSPVYYAHPSGRILSFLDRVFISGAGAMAYKPGASVSSARRAGTTASMDVLNKYFSINKMPIVSSNYWNMVHGNKPEEVAQDLEGLQIMRTLGQNMAWMIKCIEAGRAAGIDHPQAEAKIKTSFIR